MTPRSLLPLALALGLAGCALGPDYLRPASPLPATYTVSGDKSARPDPAPQPRTPVNRTWWRLFDDATLNTLVDQALENNTDLAATIGRVDEASALAREAGALFFPQIDGQLGGSNQKQSQKTATWNSAAPDILRSRTASLGLSYEIDLWGRVRRGNEAVRATLLASQHNRDALRLSLAGLVTSAYLALRGLDADLAIIDASQKSHQETLALVKVRSDAGLVSPLDEYQAAAALAAIQAQAAELRRQRALAEHQLALLTGKPALTLAPGDLNQLPTPPAPPAGLPADLIDARPDVREAEARLIAANASIGVAIAGYFPQFNLTGALGSQAASTGDLFTSGAGTWSVGLGLLAPLLDFGRTSARVDQARAVNAQSLAAWQGTLQSAYKEVRDALVNLREREIAEVAHRERQANTGHALALARQRYEAGISSYLDVLVAQRDDNAAALDVIATRQARLAATVDLFKALGGGWTTGPSAQPY